MWLLTLLVGAALPIVAIAESSIPASDAEVLERLPYLASDPIARELRDLRTELARDPDDLDLALRLARRYVTVGRANSDPRYYGYAQAALQPWWDLAQPPSKVLVLRATLRQNRHAFDAALADLSQALASDPRDAQAWITRAVILQVRGQYSAALRACLPLFKLAEPLSAVACSCSAGSLSGQAAESYEVLRHTLASAPRANAEVRLWALTLLADIAARLNKPEAAAQHFKSALSLGLYDVHLQGAYADFLLDRGQPAEVVALLKGDIRADGLLLRLALAEKALGSQSSLHIEQLKARFVASRLRGEAVHRGEEARFTLHLLEQPRAALQLALANWAVQREPRDARIVLEAALAAGDPGAARPALERLHKTSLEDIQLADLAAKLEAIRQ